MRLMKKGLAAVVHRVCEGPVARLTADAPVLMKVCDKYPGTLDA